MSEPTIQSPSDRLELSEGHKCDRCGAHAYVQVFFAQGFLLFCAHHYKKHEGEIAVVSKYIYDRRDLLEPDSR